MRSVLAHSISRDHKSYHRIASLGRAQRWMDVTRSTDCSHGMSIIFFPICRPSTRVRAHDRYSQYPKVVLASSSLSTFTPRGISVGSVHPSPTTATSTGRPRSRSQGRALAALRFLLIWLVYKVRRTDRVTDCAAQELSMPAKPSGVYSKVEQARNGPNNRFFSELMRIATEP